MKILLISFALLGIVTAASDAIIYQNLIIPMLPTVNTVSFLWWLLLFCPTLVSCVLLGIAAKSFTQAIGICVVGGLGTHIYNYYAAINHLPGHIKSISSEYPLVALINITIYFIIIISIYLIKQNLSKTKKPINHER